MDGVKVVGPFEKVVEWTGQTTTRCCPWCLSRGLGRRQRDIRTFKRHSRPVRECAAGDRTLDNRFVFRHSDRRETADHYALSVEVGGELIGVTVGPALSTIVWGLPIVPGVLPIGRIVLTVLSAEYGAVIQ
mgnify:FL=1